ncbi:MAG: NAD(P)-dependent oxidoreductase [Cyanobacteria bacterium P01_F01_bin.33]
MTVARFETCVIFGGTGFIGIHLARHLLFQGMADRVFLADIAPLDPASWPPEVGRALDVGKLSVVRVDVRQPIDHPALPEHVDLIVNLAAIHREPGHEPFEYYETNLLGAEHVCAWAELTGCEAVMFTSSIAPYGPTEEPKDEDALPVPESAYGNSKLVAEKIHLTWQRGDRERRQLSIVRPGVVYGPGEGGNVSRLVRAVLHRYFIYTGNRTTRKAGGYVKELCHAMVCVWNWQREHGQRVALFNFTADPALTMEEYVRAVCETAGVQRFVPALPYPLLLGASYPIEVLSRILGIRQPVSPVRIRKLVRSNHIQPAFLRAMGYEYRYTTAQALADWQKERPEDWI